MKREKSQRLDSFEPAYDLTPHIVERLNNIDDTSFKMLYLRSEVLSKFVSDATDPPDVRRNRAIFKWLVTERENEATNDRLTLTPSDYQILPRIAIGDFMSWCAAYIGDIIGDTPPVDALIGSFSGGASTSRGRTHSQPAWKYVGKAHATSRCLDWLDLLTEECPVWLQGSDRPQFEVVPGNVLFTVPKKTDIDRVACKEPDLNMFIQKGVGGHFRKCLRRRGINLNDQSRNRLLAKTGSIDGSLATLDLTSASDSVSTELVFQLLPVTWFYLLDSIRSHVTVIDGDEHRNHMFSSMGNGFTFELESLLFYTLARAVAYFTGTSGIISVYGDDIICPTAMSYELTWVLAFMGFQVNPDKSHTVGSFRESCGGHYNNGYEVTPFYIKAPVDNLVSVIHVANQLREWASGKNDDGSVEEGSIIDPDFEELWLWLKGHVPECLWGGDDYSFKYQLASNDAPSMRLFPESKSTDSGVGGYYQWLNTTMGRTHQTDGVETSRFSSSRNRYRLRRVRSLAAVTALPSLFIHELG